jgi:hypothetical protein
MAIDFPNSPSVGQQFSVGGTKWIWTGAVWDLLGAGDSFDPTLVSYTHVQGVVSDIWTIIHNLGYAPGGITVLDSAGTMVEGDIQHVSLNECIITFSAAFSGTAYLS